MTGWKGAARREKLRRTAEREYRRYNQAAYCEERDRRNKQQRELEKAVARAERAREE